MSSHSCFEVVELFDERLPFGVGEHLASVGGLAVTPYGLLFTRGAEAGADLGPLAVELGDGLVDTRFELGRLALELGLRDVLEAVRVVVDLVDEGLELRDVTLIPIAEEFLDDVQHGEGEIGSTSEGGAAA